MCDTIILPALCIPEHQLNIWQSTEWYDRCRDISDPDKEYGFPQDAFGPLMTTFDL